MSWFVAAALGLAWLPAQTGSIAGKITDASGGLLPGVTVTIKAEARTQTAVTNDKGEYRIDHLQPGPYRIEASLSGFTPVPVENVVVEATRVTAWNTTLQVARRGPADPFGDFGKRVKQIVGQDPMDCGQHRLQRLMPLLLNDVQKSLACVLEAVAQKKSVWMSYQVQGIDGVILYGVAGTTNGAIFQLSYDSDTGAGDTYFLAEPCAKPALITVDSHVRVRCS